MRYDAEHKERSRARIVESARRLFRSEGFDGVSIDRVMKDAGLTRGAFYAHFDSKDDLVHDSLGIESGLARALARAAAADDPRAAAWEAVGDYLDPDRVDPSATACPLAAHAVDALRGGDALREGYGERFGAVVQALENLLGPDHEDEAVLIAMLAVGGVVFGAASGDGALSDRIARVAGERISEALRR